MEKKRLKYFSTLTFCLSLSYSVVADSLQPHGLQPTRLLSPCDFPGKDTGVVCHFLLQGVFLTQGIKLWSPALQADSLQIEQPGKLRGWVHSFFFWMGGICYLKKSFIYLAASGHSCRTHALCCISWDLCDTAQTI